MHVCMYVCMFFSLRVSFQANVLGALAESCRPPVAVGVEVEAAVASSQKKSTS